MIKVAKTAEAAEATEATEVAKMAQIAESYKTTSRRNGRILLLFCICLSIVMLFPSKAMFDDNFIYAIEQIHEFDNEIYANSISVISPTGSLSPKLISNKLMAGLTYLFDGNWNNAALLLIRINYLMYTLAFFLIVVKLFNSSILAALIVSVTGLTGSLISLAFGMNGAEDVFLGTGIAIAMLAIVLVLGKTQYWTASWILLGISEIMHVHEGIWGGSIVGLIWISDCIINKRILWQNIKALPIFLLSLLAVVFPALKNSGVFDENLFNQIYVFIRTPHHFLISSWGALTITLSGAMLVFALVLLRNSKNDKKRYTTLFSLLIIWWILLLLAQYISTEIFPSSTMSTMNMTKCFKYITWIASLIYIKLGTDLIQEKKFFQGLCLFGIVIMPNITNPKAVIIETMLFLLFLILYLSTKERKIPFFNAHNTVIILCITLLCKIALQRSKLLLLSSIFVIAFVSYLCYQEELKMHSEQSAPKSNKHLHIGLVFCTIFSLVYSMTAFEKGATVFDAKIKLLTGDRFVEKAMGKDVYKLAKRYKDNSAPTITYLADPYDRASNGIQLVSRRSCYAIWKDIPPNKVTTIEWYERIVKAKKLVGASAFVLNDFMTANGISDILVSQDQVVALDNASNLFKCIDREGDYAIFRLKDN